MYYYYRNCVSSSHHYVEYLCYNIREKRLETIEILSTDDLEIVVRRQNIRMPPRPFGIVDGIYRLELVKVREPLNTKNVLAMLLCPVRCALW